jgi:hypothetical protein
MEDLMVNARPVLSLLLLAALAAPVALASVSGQRPGDDNTLYVVLPRDAIPAISTPEFEPARPRGSRTTNWSSASSASESSAPIRPGSSTDMKS